MPDRLDQRLPRAWSKTLVELTPRQISSRLRIYATLCSISSAAAFIVGLTVFSANGAWSKETFLLAGGLLGLTLGLANTVMGHARTLHRVLKAQETDQAIGSITTHLVRE